MWGIFLQAHLTKCGNPWANLAIEGWKLSLLWAGWELAKNLWDVFRSKHTYQTIHQSQKNMMQSFEKKSKEFGRTIPKQKTHIPMYSPIICIFEVRSAETEHL